MEVKNVKVIGVGGIGLHLLEPLCRYVNFNVDIDGIDVHLIDGDKFEHRNQERQKFTETGNKAEVTANRLRDDFQNVMFWDHPDYITEDNTLLHIREEDCILLCVDNHATRKLVVERCQELDNVTLISGGNDYTDGNVSVYLRRDGEDLTKPPTMVYPEMASPDDENPGDAEEREEGAGCAAQAAAHPQLVVANNMAAALMLNAFYGLLNGDVGSGAYGDIYFDVKVNSTRHNERAKV